MTTAYFCDIVIVTLILARREYHMNISAARERAGITQGELAKRMEVTQGAV